MKLTVALGAMALLAGCSSDPKVLTPSGGTDPSMVGVGGSLVGVGPDVDTDGDGTPDLQEGTGDADGDGIPAHRDPDENGTGGTGGGTSAGASAGTSAGTTGGGTSTTATTGLNGGTSGGDGGAGTTSASFGTATDPECDLNGYWVGRQSTFSSALNGNQIASAWTYFRLSQQGDTVVVEDHLDCGVYVGTESGSIGGVTVQLARASMEILATKNPQAGRMGSITRSADSSTCDLSFERFYSARGADPATYLPMGPHDSRELPALQADIAIPAEATPEGAEDWNGPSQAGLGVAWSVSGAATGVRWSVQRDWNVWATDAAHSITPAAVFDEITMGARFLNEENVMKTDGGFLLSMLATALTDNPRNQMTLKFLGKTEAEAADILGIAEVGERCLAVQAKLPHVEP